MKYLNVVSTIRKTADYRKDEKYFNDYLGSKNVKNAIDNAEVLQRELKKRYDDRAEEMDVKMKLEKLEIKEKQEKAAKDKLIEEKSKSNGSINLPDPSKFDENMSSWQLETMMKQKSTSFLIFDVRSKEDFEKSHINHSNCISIPEDILKPG